jgi:hypothetical protein
MEALHETTVAIIGGDRLPWVSYHGGDNFEPPRSLDWQLVYGDASGEFAQACTSCAIPLHTFASDEGAKNASLARDAAYPVRPDRYVALASEGAESVGRLRTYSAIWNLSGARS